MSDDEIDKLVIEHLTTLSQILALYHHLEDSLALGRFQLAKTRHNLPGNGSRISSTAYNLHEMSTRGATLRIMTCKNETNGDGADETTSKAMPQFQVVDDLLVDGVHMDPTADPIRWFAGVLVPASLRRAQASFRRSIHLSISLANLRTKLEASSRRLRILINARGDQKSDVADLPNLRAK
ncbi:hypothetical protein CRM22_003499 [Opisthorchis felineus]|uniref:Vacuolar ATPase assembly protein VMA22 n=1 Tax=Opisthorchis felineus TaxID=147828 RepID=A0A4S2M1H8_OPIFE|nr:hypothetical protein CRM22_003499 [Opisthorchis felineus]TGZ69866.1 hypothetical protein CRM22_003499 [Opisthorchis felineus]